MTKEQAKQIIAAAKIALPSTTEGMEQLRQAFRVLANGWASV